jgi:hypothetical protein
MVKEMVKVMVVVMMMMRRRRRRRKMVMEWLQYALTKVC